MTDAYGYDPRSAVAYACERHGRARGWKRIYPRYRMMLLRIPCLWCPPRDRMLFLPPVYAWEKPA